MTSLPNTVLIVQNATSEDVTVYVTFAAPNPNNQCCPNPVGVSNFPVLQQVPHNSLQGFMTLAPGATQTFDPQCQCFSGNVGFYIQPQCPVTGTGVDFHNGLFGTSIAEFTLNPIPPCTETIDISCVNGINCFIQIQMEPNAGWTYGSGTPISLIANGPFGAAGLPGVYPVNCPTCTSISEPPVCSTLPSGPPQTQAICNVSRPVGLGGSVTIILVA